ncbi:MAG: glycosyltransferase family 1 protein [Cytophagales bacterium]|nr:MAG: glycosyltransferase family 1 protein [Cytophagales bacterium]
MQSLENEPQKLHHKALFAAFDVYPSAKGAAIHIYHNAKALFEYKKGGILLVVGNEKLPTWQQEENIEIHRFQNQQQNYLQRTEQYMQWVSVHLSQQNNLEIAHFRDIWSGIPILLHQKKYQKNFHTIFEVNALTSIELPYRYPQILPITIHKIQQQEQFCLENATHIITPSNTIKQNIIEKYNLPPEKITVITNGADIPKTFQKPTHLPPKYLIYIGALQPWQGINTLFKAFQILQNHQPDLHLVICSAVKAKAAKPYKKIAEKLGISAKIIWQYQLRKKTLANYLKHAIASLAPLTECSRNITQGCCPIKILESMATATPIFASEMPATQEIITHQKNGILIRPDRPQQWARTLQEYIEQPQTLQKIAQNAKKHIEKYYTWQQKREELKKLYQNL